MIWEELSSLQLAKAGKSLPVMVNISATEQHGNHLPLGTDRIIGDYFCRKLNDRIADKVLLLPNLSIGYSRHHLGFPGTLSLSHSTLIAQLEEIVDSVFAHKFTKFILFNSHGGNQALGQVFIEKMGDKYPHGHFFMMNWFRLAVEELRKLSESGPGGIGHGGEFETSLMLRIAPHLVDENNISSMRNIPTFSWAEGDLLQGAEVSYYRSMSSMTKNGIYGDPRFATADKGAKIEKVVVTRMTEIVNDIFNISASE
ncbi:creatininase family protein [Membranihabitans marinus]|nr:creatininase family protein [Membranihabitans marinus]